MKTQHDILYVVLFAIALLLSGCSDSDTQGTEQSDSQVSALEKPGSATEPAPKAPPDFELLQTGKVISPGFFDMTQRWRERFGLDGRLQIEDGRRDERPSYADGPIELTFKATPTEPGVYTFVFALLDSGGLPSRIQAVHLYVIDDHHNENPSPIHPEGQSSWTREIATGQQITVNWWGGGGLGPPGAPIGWRLSEVVYKRTFERFQSPGIPGYNYRGGE